MSSPNGLTRWHIALVIAITLLLIVAVAFRIVALDHLPGVNGDEAYYGAIVMALRAGEKPSMVSGSGLPLNPFYIDLLYGIHAVFPTPSFGLLRLPALISGLVLLALAFPLLARVRDGPTAITATLLLACCPTAIAYSRFGWDQSQAPLAALLCLYIALERRGMHLLVQVIGGAMLFGVALVIHPINVFLLPILLGPAAFELGARLAGASPENRRRLLLWLEGGLLVVIALAFVALKVLVPANIVQMYTANLLPGIGARLIDVRGWAEFAARFGDLLTGTTVYRYIAGPVPDWSVWLQRVLFWALTLLLLIRGVPQLYRRGDRTALGLLTGLAVSLAGFYLMIGTHLIGPALERYSMWLITPSCLALAILWRNLGSDGNLVDAIAAGSPPEGVALAEPDSSIQSLAVGNGFHAVPGAPAIESVADGSRNATEAVPCRASGPGVSQVTASAILSWTVLVLVCALLLGGFARHYFGVLLETGGQTHRTFRTAAVEPKQAALEVIFAATAGQPATILAEDWWTFFPLYYLAGDRRELRVEWCKNAILDVKKHPSPRRHFVVGFAGGACDRWLTKQAPGLACWTIADYSGRAVLHVWDLGTDTTHLPGLAETTAAAPPDEVPE